MSPDGARRWAEIIPNARLIMLSGAGHLAYIERSDRVLPALMGFSLLTTCPAPAKSCFAKVNEILSGGTG